MALHMTSTTARLNLAVCLSLILASCSTGKGPSAIAVASATSDSSQRFSAEELQYAGTPTAYTRTYVNSDDIEANAPEVYTVVRGDTLWDISDRFLKEPWRWPEIWGYNPQVHNPHLIYPKDELALNYVNGKPILSLTRNGKLIPIEDKSPTLAGANKPTDTSDVEGANGGARVKLAPRIRVTSLDDAIPMIASDAISHLLVSSRVVDERTTYNAPYVLANSDNTLASSVGNKIYVRGRVSRDETNYGVFRKSNRPLIDPANGASLGFEVTHVADAKLLSVGEPSTMIITDNKQETIAGDLLLPMATGKTTHTYTPRMPELRGEGRVVSLVNAISQSGRNQVVVLNVGDNSSIQEGDVLAVETRGVNVVDKRRSGTRETVKLPNERTGVLLVFKTFDKVSYALVMESTRPIKVNDIVTGI